MAVPSVTCWIVGTEIGLGFEDLNSEARTVRKIPDEIAPEKLPGDDVGGPAIEGAGQAPKGRHDGTIY